MRKAAGCEQATRTLTYFVVKQSPVSSACLTKATHHRPLRNAEPLCRCRGTKASIGHRGEQRFYTAANGHRCGQSLQCHLERGACLREKYRVGERRRDIFPVDRDRYRIDGGVVTYTAIERSPHALGMGRRRTGKTEPRFRCRTAKQGRNDLT